MNYNFFAYLNRMKYIKRWSLMHSMIEENVMEHTEQVSIIAHTLAAINNRIYGGDVSIEKCVLYAQYHETSEVITGDLPTPIKYYNKQINGAYKDLEKKAAEKMISLLPDGLKDEFEQYVIPDEQSEEYAIMKAADKLSAYIKCLEEIKSGNREFIKAKETLINDINNIQRNDVKYFVKNILPSFELTLDELE